MLHGWLMDIAKALDFIHAQGHIHRDVKPANILFDRHGNAFLADFGVVKSLDAPEVLVKGQSGVTSPGYLLGTPNYLAPELVMGFPGDGRGDQYALALTVHEALTGWNCMEGPTPSATLVNQTKVDPPRLSSLLRGVAPRVSDAVARGLAKEPLERFETCSILARAILGEVPPLVPGRPVSTPELISPASKGAPGRVPCPHCGGLLPVVREHAGRRITCTRCRATAMVQLAAGTVQLLLVNPPPQAPRIEPPRVPLKARPIDLGITTEPESGLTEETAINRRRWIGAGLAGLGLVSVGGVVGWFLGRWSVRDRAGPRNNP
jgi:serine/threonine-protein kinase